MSAQEFHNARQNASGAPVTGEPSVEAAPQANSAPTGLQHVVDEKGVKRLLIPNSATGKLQPAKFADEYDYPGANPADIARAKNLWVAKGGAIIGETHDEQGNVIKNETAEAAAEPIRPEKFKRQVKPKTSGTGAASEYEAKLRRQMPQGPGTGKATRNQATILQNAANNLRILKDHHNKLDLEMTSKDGLSLPDHPAYAAHTEAGAHLALAEHLLDLANKAKKLNDVSVANNHMRSATDALHTANKILHNPVFDITKAGESPLGNGVTDEDRAHALVEFPMENPKGNLNKTLKMGRGPNSQVENSRDTFEKLVKIHRGVVSKDPKYAGLNKDVVKKFLKWSQFGTPKGSEEWSEGAPGPQTPSSTSMGPGFDTIGYGGARPFATSNVNGSTENIVKTNKLMVAVHPNAAPKGAFLAKELDPRTKEPTGRTALVHKGVEIPIPLPKDIKYVEFGKHIGLKVIDKNGYEVPHMDENNKPMTWEELQNAGAATKTVTERRPVQPLPQATKPAAPSEPKPRNWDTLNKRSRAAVTRRNDAAQAEIEKKIQELEDEKALRISSELHASDLLKEQTPDIDPELASTKRKRSK